MLRIGVACGILAGLCFVGPAKAAESAPSTAAETVSLFIGLLKKGEVEAAAKLVEGLKAEDLKSPSESLKNGKVSISVVEAKEDGNLAYVILRIVQDDDTQISGGPVVRKDGRWTLSRDPEAALDEAGKQRLAALKKWSEARCEELKKALPTTRP